MSLQLQGVTLSSDSLVDVDDILQFPEPSNAHPDNGNGYHDQALLCLTNLEDCCNDQHKIGNWYYPGGNAVKFDSWVRATFRRNRGPNEVINDQQFYGSVRLFRRGDPPVRGRFRCELPNAANPFVNRVLYANIRELRNETLFTLISFFFFSISVDIGAVTISPSDSNTAGEDFSLVCSADIVTQDDTPSPHFQWFFGPNNNSLPFRTPITNNSRNTYTSTLYFSPLSQSHAGMYTCRLGGNARLAARATLTVNVGMSLCQSLTPDYLV